MTHPSINVQVASERREERAARRSLSRRLTVGLCLAFLLLLSGTLWLSFLSARDALYSQFDDLLHAQARFLIAWVEQRNDEVLVHTRNSRFSLPFEGLDSRQEASDFQIWDWNRKLVAHHHAEHADVFPLRFGTVERPEFWNFARANGDPLRAVGLTFLPRADSRHDPSVERREVYLVLASDRRDIDKAITRQGRWHLGIGGGLLALVGLTVPFVIRLSLSPLERVTQQAETIEADALNARFPVDGMPAELIPICECLNRLLERLERSFQRERGFTSDVAHELLTPLAELRSLAEFALRYPDADCRETIRQSLEILLRIEAIITTLLDLCRAEQAQTAFVKEDVAIRTLVESILARHTAQIVQRKLVMDIQIPEAACVSTDPIRFGSIVSNLLSNAVEHADAYAQVSIRWMLHRNDFDLAISNSAKGLRSDQIDKLFDRFWRSDEARSSSGHFGLGLTLSRQLAQALKLTLKARLSDRHELTITLSGPVA